MKIDKSQNSSTSINISDHVKNERNRSASKDNNKKNSNVIFAGDLNIQKDPIDSKKRQAARQALKTLMDQHKNEKGLDDKVDKMKERQRKLYDEAALSAKHVQDLKSKKAELKSSYGIDSNSDEQKNLDLLEKSIFSPDKMTSADYERLKSIGPLTDYQKDALKNDAMQKIFQERVDASANDIMNINHSITSMAIERLKTHPMVDAQKEAAQILEAASKEVITTLLEDGKTAVDDKMKEIKEDAERKQEEQEKNNSSSDPTDPANDHSGLSVSEQTKQLQNADELKRIAKKQNLIEEDIKGLEVDEKA